MTYDYLVAVHSNHVLSVVASVGSECRQCDGARYDETVCRIQVPGGIQHELMRIYVIG